MEKYGTTIEYKVGTMIEVPRGAVTADKIAESAGIFPFEQMTLLKWVLVSQEMMLVNLSKNM